MSREALLPVVSPPSSERADAARNRRKILDAAAALVARRGVRALTMDQVAAAAGVGVGTVYRRFTDRATLAYALIDAGERAFQAAFLSGPPPMGPGAPPYERIRAFLHAYVDRLEGEAELLAIAETSTPSARYATAAYALHRSHLAMLIAGLRPGADAGYLADALLAPLAGALFAHQHDDQSMTGERIKAGLDDLLAGFQPSETRSAPA
ncbi:TetR family transcriptional regulator [Streptosporangium soli]|nr:TetR family transcriptional regulator [Streptosporangium sp. KLBMP 9127]